MRPDLRRDQSVTYLSEPNAEAVRLKGMAGAEGIAEIAGIAEIEGVSEIESVSEIRGIAVTKRVRVSYQPTGHGLALMITAPDAVGADGSGADYQDGLLHITDACVTLELPAIDGRGSVLAWDPSEVDWQSWTVPIPA